MLPDRNVEPEGMGWEETDHRALKLSQELGEFWCQVPTLSTWRTHASCGPEGLQSSPAQLEIAGCISTCGCDVHMPELIANGYEINTSLEQGNGTRMSKQVRPDSARKGWVGAMDGGPSLREDVVDAVPGQAVAAHVLENGPLTVSFSGSTHCSDCFERLRPQRTCALLPSFSVESDSRARQKVFVPNSYRLAFSCTGVIEKQDECIVTESDGSTTVWISQQ